MISYLEEKIMNSTASDNEQLFYENYIWNNQFDKKSPVLMYLINEMNLLYYEK